MRQQNTGKSQSYKTSYAKVRLKPDESMKLHKIITEQHKKEFPDKNGFESIAHARDVLTQNGYRKISSRVYQKFSIFAQIFDCRNPAQTWVHYWRE